MLVLGQLVAEAEASPTLNTDARLLAVGAFRRRAQAKGSLVQEEGTFPISPDIRRNNI